MDCFIFNIDTSVGGLGWERRLRDLITTHHFTEANLATPGLRPENKHLQR